MKKVLIFLCMLFTSVTTSIVFAENWVKYHNQACPGFYDKDSIVREGQYVKVWLLTSAKRNPECKEFFSKINKLTKNNIPTQREIIESKTRIHFDCAKREFRFIYLAEFDAAGILVTGEEDRTAWKTVIPGTSTEYLMNAVCKQLK